MNVPNTPFSTRLSGSAKEAELRIRNIFQWKKKRPPVIALVAAVLVVVFCGSLIGFTTTPRNGTLGELYQVYFAENPTNMIDYENKEAACPSLDSESENFDAALEYVRSMELRSVLGQKKYIGDFSNRNGAVVLRSADGQELWIDLYRTGYVVVSNKGAGRLNKGDDAKVYKVSEGFDVGVFLNYLAAEQDIGPTLTLVWLSEIGKTFNLLWEENPDLEYQSIDIPDASGQCLGEAQSSFLYFFFGTQSFPGLSELSAEHGDQLRCAGIVSTIGEVFPETTEGLSLEKFFADHNISEYTYNLEEDRPDRGWIEFYCDGYFVWINTNDSGAYSSDYVKATTMKRDYPVVIIDTEIWDDNYSIWDDNYMYWNDYVSTQTDEDEPQSETSAEPVDGYERNGRLATIDGISHMPLDELPQEVLDSLTLVSETDLSGMYNPEWGWCRTYTAPGLEITTTAPSAVYLEWREEVDKNNREMFPTEEDFYAYIEGEEGREWLVNVAITDDKYATLDGLKVGMTCAQAETLGYSLHEGQNQIGNTEVELSIIVENDTVVQMKTWWTMGRYIGKFFEL